MNRCDACGREGVSGICERCASEIRWAGSDSHEEARRYRRQAERALTGALTSLPEAYALLPGFLLPGSLPPDPDRRAATSSPARPPLRLEVVDLLDGREKPDADLYREDYDLDRRAGSRRQGVLPTLASWVRLTDSELWESGIDHGPPADVPTVATECGWLLGHAAWILDQRWGHELAAEVTAMLGDVQAATGWQPVEPDKCPSCGWIVEARDGGAWWSCTGCPRTWAMHAEISKLAAVQEHSLTLREVAADLDRPLATVKAWVASGRLLAVATGPRGRLYDVREARRIDGTIPTRTRAG